jgi:hypothetical protein
MPASAFGRRERDQTVVAQVISRGLIRENDANLIHSHTFDGVPIDIDFGLFPGDERDAVGLPAIVDFNFRLKTHEFPLQKFFQISN